MDRTGWNRVFWLQDRTGRFLSGIRYLPDLPYTVTGNQWSGKVVSKNTFISAKISIKTLKSLIWTNISQKNFMWMLCTCFQYVFWVQNVLIQKISWASSGIYRNRTGPDRTKSLFFSSETGPDDFVRSPIFRPDTVYGRKRFLLVSPYMVREK